MTRATQFETWTLTDVDRDLWLDALTVNADSLKQATTPATPAWSITKRTLHGGLREGVDLIEVDNGILQFSVVPTRGMGLWRGSYRGVPLGWQAPLRGPVHPKFVTEAERGGLGWLGGFDELLCRCGLNSIGPPGEDVRNDERGTNRSTLTLHGRIANRPAHAVSVKVGLDSPHELSVRGEVEEAGLFAARLQLTTTYTTEVGSRRIQIHDVVENRGGLPAEMQLLYHCNVGAPLLDAGSRFLAALRAVAPANARAAEGIDTLDRYAGPVPGFVEQCYLYELIGNAGGQTVTLLHNAAGDFGLALRFNLNELPCFTQWKNTAALEDGYVTGLEPGLNYPNFRTYERQHGRVRLLPPRGRWECRWWLELCGTVDEVNAVKQEITSLQGQMTARLHRLPQPRFSAG